MPPCSTSAATRSTSAGVSGCSSPVSLCVNSGERHSPGALARDAPVGPALDHAVDALLAPGGRPLDLADLLECRPAQPRLLHADEPLRGCTEDHRGLVTPAMRVAVTAGLVVQQRALLRQHLDHVRIRVEDFLAGEERRRRQEPPVAADRVIDQQAVLAADDEVLLAMARSRVHRARAAVERDVLAEDRRHAAVVERMAQHEALQLGALATRDLARRRDTRALQHGRRKLRREHQQLLAAARLDREQRVIELRMQRDRLVRRQRPGRGRPDDDAGAARRQAREAEASREIGPVDDLEAHVDRRRGALLVLDLGLRQRRAAVEAPVHGLVALVEMAVADDLRERPQLLRLVARREREVRVRPVAHDAEPDEVLALHVHLLASRTRGRPGGTPSRRAASRRGPATSRPGARSAARGSPSPARRAHRSRRACAT